MIIVYVLTMLCKECLCALASDISVFICSAYIILNLSYYIYMYIYIYTVCIAVCFVFLLIYYYRSDACY